MNRRVNLFQRWLIGAWVWLAVWALRHTPFVVVRAEALDAAREELLALHALSYRSGHLTRAYHAGRAVRQRSEAGLDALTRATGDTRCTTSGTYASPEMRRLYFNAPGAA